MPSKPVIRHQRFAAALRSSFETHEDALLEGLQERLGPLLGEGAVIDAYKTVHQFFLDALAAREDSMVAADEAHLAEEMDDRHPRRLRDQAALRVVTVLVGIRRAATGHFGVDGAEEFLNLVGRTGQDPVTLFRQGTRVMERLRSTELAPPTSALSDGMPDREGWAARLEPALTALEEALDTVGHEERELALTRATKAAAVEAFQQDSRALARTLEWIMVLAGRRDLSEEVRPGRLNRRARAAAEGENPPDAEPSDEETPDEEAPEGTGNPNPPGPPTMAGNSGTAPP